MRGQPVIPLVRSKSVKAESLRNLIRASGARQKRVSMSMIGSIRNARPISRMIVHDA